MKITMRAVLLDVEDTEKQAIDELMTVFCSAVRYSFNRINEGVKIGDIEKNVALKYRLNIRQAKDAVENARQTIVSQKELLKMNYENYIKKARAIEKKLKNNNEISTLRKNKNKQSYKNTSTNIFTTKIIKKNR